MVLPTAQAYLAKWGTNLGAAQPYIKAGVMATQQAPGVAAAAAADRMLAGITASVQSGQWASRVAGVSLASWQNAMINKGLPRLAQGITSAQANKIPQITALLNSIQTSQQAIANLPRGGLEANIARMVAFSRAMNANAPSKQNG